MINFKLLALIIFIILAINFFIVKLSNHTRWHLIKSLRLVEQGLPRNVPTIFLRYCHGSFLSSVADVRTRRANLQKLMRPRQKSACKRAKISRPHRPFTFRVALAILGNIRNYLQRITCNACKLRNRFLIFFTLFTPLFEFKFWIKIWIWI